MILKVANMASTCTLVFRIFNWLLNPLYHFPLCFMGWAEHLSKLVVKCQRTHKCIEFNLKIKIKNQPNSLSARFL